MSSTTFEPTMVRDWEVWERAHPNASDSERLEAAIQIWNDGFAACFAYCDAVKTRIGM